MRLTQPHLIPDTLSYELIKNALQSERFEEITKVGRYFLRFDPQVSAEVYKRRLLVARLPVVLESSDLKLQEAFNKIQKHGWYHFVFSMTDALFFGCAYFFRGYKNGGLDYSPIDVKYLNCDDNGVFVYSGSQRIYLDNRTDVLKVGQMDTFNSVCYRVLSIAALKFVAMSKYMTYLENLSVPPLILKSDGFDDDKELNKLLDNLEDLRAASIGIFSKDDILELLNGNVDQGAFLEFLRYCDECISKVISGQVLASNAVNKGTQALGNV
ncbi:phage portal protein family protein, partial [Helicobacter suis]|uniref:phage portal protein family protein n=1 Tax=Helicobacter suis TaxID=104628 RepID=UPI0013D767FF